jgi:GNAT superfamily N-acetyltransferase
MEWQRGGFSISTDPDRLDRALIHRFLSASYWAPDVPRAIVDRSIDNSMPFGLYDGAAQVGFARVITDRATFAYLADVFMLESHRGRGFALWLMQAIRAHPELQDVRRWVLFTRDAHPLYRKVGFKDIENDPPRCMEIVDRGIYARMKDERR